jgi:eukaryotic-like serine/threonine-protein kinase
LRGQQQKELGMPLSASDVSALGRLLDVALDLPPAEIETWLQELPAELQHLQPQLRRLLAERTGRAGFLSSLPNLQPLDESVARAGDMVGAYRLIREIGRGGMGAVWLAERVDGSLKRKVALKLPRLAWGAGLAGRMARERDIGALLEHPTSLASTTPASTSAAGRSWRWNTLKGWRSTSGAASTGPRCRNGCGSSCRSCRRWPTRMAGWSCTGT